MLSKARYISVFGLIASGALGLFDVVASAGFKSELLDPSLAPMQKGGFSEGEFYSSLIDAPAKEKVGFSKAALDLNVHADSQLYDPISKRFVVEGNVTAFLNGGTLKADRIEFDSQLNEIYANGSVRFSKGSQYLQASNLRYNLTEKKGVLEDVYGVINLKTVSNDFSKVFDNSKGTPQDLSALNKFSPQLEIKAGGVKDIACPPDISNIPEWHPHPWALTAWGGKMTDANFGKTFFLKGDLRPEYLLGFGLQKRIYRAGPFSIELEADLFNHKATQQKGGKYNQSTPYSKTKSQNFQEAILGIGARIWLMPWLSISALEGLSYNTSSSNYESTFREKYARLLNYLSFEIDASLSKQVSLVGRIHHRSGAFGFFGGTREGSNAYLLGLRYRWGQDKNYLSEVKLSAPLGCSRKKRKELEDQDRRINRLRDQETIREKEILEIDQRIENIKLREKLAFEGRLGVQSMIRNVDEKNRYGGVRVSQLISKKRSKFITGSISKWRFQALNLFIGPEGWSSEKVSFTNDPLTPSQTRIDANDVTVTEDINGDILIKSGKNRLILEERFPVPILRKKRIKQKEEFQNRWIFGIDNKDRDGFFVGRQFRPIELNQHFTLFLRPQFMLQRSYQGETKSYIPSGRSVVSSKSTQVSKPLDLFGMRSELRGKLHGWDVEINSDISSFNSQNLANASRYWLDANRAFNLPAIGSVNAHIFSAYRYRIWNGSLGETSIYSAYGSLIEKRDFWNIGKLSNYYIVRFGIGDYQARLFDEPKLDRMIRTNLFASITSIYNIWSSNNEQNQNLPIAYRYSPELVRPGLSFMTNIKTSMAGYSVGSMQKLLTFSGGPSLTLGRFDKPYLSYSKLSMTAGATFLDGSSPFAFDRVVDLATLGFGLSQQIAGPLVLDSGVEFNVDKGSKYFGQISNSNIQLRWQRRSYDMSLYFSPHTGVGGLKLSLNDFDFKGTGLPFLARQEAD